MIIFLGCSGALYVQLETNCPVAANCHSMTLFFIKPVPLCSYIHSPFCSPIFHSVLAVICHVLGGASPPGAWVWFFKIVFSALHCAHQLGGWVGVGQVGKQRGQ